MSEPTPPPPPPTGQPSYAPPPAKKKGLPPLAWVGIGCGALILIGVIAVGVGMWWVGNKAKDFAVELEANPAYAAAKMAIQVNPELELLESDDEAGTLTVRNKSTGEVVTFDLEEIQQGKLEIFTEGGEETSVTFSAGEGGLEVQSEEGGKSSRLRIGGAAAEIPSWVPVYPDTEPSSPFISESAEGTQGAFTLTTGDSPDEVISWYTDEIGALGMEPQSSTFSTAGSRGGMVAGTAGGRRLDATVASQGDDTLVTVTFSERRE